MGRTDISAQIEQLLRDQRRPPLLLYGQRRMGKTSLLNNLGRLLPNTIVPLFVDLQGPATRATDHAGFLYNIARKMVDSAEKQRGKNVVVKGAGEAGEAGEEEYNFSDSLSFSIYRVFFSA